MIQRGCFWFLLCSFILAASTFICPAFAEIKVFEKEVEAIIGEGQSQSQVESLAIQRAKRMAVEEAGTYISTLTVVQNYQLQRDEVTAMASSVVRAVPIGASIRETNGVTYIKVRARIEVDTSTLDRQIEALMRDKGALEREEKALKRVRELEDQLANSKSPDMKRLEEFNAQALAVEREREKQRLFREEQALKAKGELSKAEADRLAREREMQERLNQRLAEQEKTKREEALALAAEQDRFRRAALESEQRFNDLARNGQLSQAQWVAIDDSLSIKQATGEIGDLKKEIANLETRLDWQYRENAKNLAAAYAQQRELMRAKRPLEPAPKDAFEATSEYKNRIARYERLVRNAEAEDRILLEKLDKERDLKLAEAKVGYLGQQIRVLTPFVERLRSLQGRKFVLPEGGTMRVDLGEPDADNNRFPMKLTYGDKSWSVWWYYRNRDLAKDFYRTKTYLKAEGLFQIEEATSLRPRLTASRVTHLGTKETMEFPLEKPRVFAEIKKFDSMKSQEGTAKGERETAAVDLARKTIINKDDRFIAYKDGTVLDTSYNLMWAAQDNGSELNWEKAKYYCENYGGGGYTDWRLPSLREIRTLYDKSKSKPSKCRWMFNEHVATDLIQFSCDQLWTSETKYDKAAKFSTLTGEVQMWPKRYKDGNYRVIPVRTAR
jgi:hypothetical protein